jgi:GxxExxY protein
MRTHELVEAGRTRSVIGAFYEVYNTLGFGFLEHAYREALARELLARGHHVSRETVAHVLYKHELVATHRLDLVVDEAVVVEVKATWRLHPAFARQLYNYLRATGLEVGLLLHFGPEPAFQRLYCARRETDSSVSRDATSRASRTVTAVETDASDAPDE